MAQEHGNDRTASEEVERLSSLALTPLQAPVLRLHVGSDALMAASCCTIPAPLCCSVRRRYDALLLVGIPLSFPAFTLLFGAALPLEISTVWDPDCRLDRLVNLGIGFGRASNAVALLTVVPWAMALQTPSPLQP